MMDHEKHLENQESQFEKSISRATARHLRRKRLKDARKNQNDPVDSPNCCEIKHQMFKQETKIIEDQKFEGSIIKSKTRKSKKKTSTISNCDQTSHIDFNAVVNKNETLVRNTVLEATNNQQIELKQKIDEIQVQTNLNCTVLKNSTSTEIDSYVNVGDSSSSKFVLSNNIMDKKENCTKTREEIKAEREAKKLSKANAKKKVQSNTNTKQDNAEPSTVDTVEKNPEIQKQNLKQPTQSSEEVKAAREAKKAVQTNAKAKAKARVENKNPKSEVQENTLQIDSRGEIKDKVESNVKTETTVNATKISVKEQVDGKSKAQLRAEGRAKQEAQRKAKLELSRNKSTQNQNVKKEATDTPPIIEKAKTTCTKQVRIFGNEQKHEVSLFKHLYHERELALMNFPTVNSNVHPAIIRLGVRYASKVIVGSNARCVALLAAIKELIHDFVRPPQADFVRGLEVCFQQSAAYLHHCRPLAVSMQNALRHLKWQMTQLPPTISDEDAKTKLENAIETYIKEQIQLAGEAISITIQTKILNGNVILTYGYSSLIQNILLDAHAAGKQFRVIVVDGRPWLEGKEQLKRLTKHGIECSYVLINALSFVMPQVSKVFLGAHAILANGAVMSRAGTAQVALIARAFNVPVLVACETHKSCERVQTDSIVYNELGDANELIQNLWLDSKNSYLTNWKKNKFLNLLNITYDVTPADLVTAVVTEIAILPCTSVPVILRIKPSEI